MSRAGNDAPLIQPAQGWNPNWPVMGYGRVSIGGGLQPNGLQCLLYMDMGETREIDADTTDLFPVGSYADPQKTLAAIYFKDGAAIQQTIDVLRDMQVEIGYTPATPPAALADDVVRDAERYRWLVSGKRRGWIWDHVLTSEDRAMGNWLHEVIDAAIAAAKGGA